MAGDKTVDLEIRGGETFTRSFSRRLKATGLLVPLAGLTSEFVVHSRRGDGLSRVLLGVTWGVNPSGARLELNALSNAFVLTLPFALTAALEWQRGEYTLWQNDSVNATRRVLLSGQVTVLNDRDGV